MKITHICQFLGVGGLEQVLFLLVSEQIKLNLKVELIVYDHDRRWVEKFEALGVVVHIEYLKKPGYDFQLLKYLKNKTKDSDIIHTHDLNPALYIAPLKLLGLSKNFIHTTHGMEHLKTHPKTKIYENFIGFCASKIICVSESFKNYYQSQLMTKKNKVIQIDNGIQTEIKVSKNKNKNQQRTAIYVARVTKLKGQLELIKIFNELDDKLILVGPSGNTDYWDKCKKNLSPNISMLGSREDINELLSQADYYVSHSFHEGLPISVLEAGVSNLPCILYDIPGHRLFNSSIDCVSLFKNSNEFKTAINNIDKIDTDRFYQQICKNYSSKTMSDKIHQIYKDIL